MHKERPNDGHRYPLNSRTRDKVEKKFGLASKQFVKDMMPVGSKQVLKTQIDRSGEDKKESLAEYLETFLIDGKKLTETNDLKRVTELCTLA